MVDDRSELERTLEYLWEDTQPPAQMEPEYARLLKGYSGPVDASKVVAGEIQTDIVGDSNVPGAIRYASENHAELPGFQTAVNNSTAGDTVILLPGSHDIGTTQTVSKRLTLVFLGTLEKAAGVSPGLLLTSDARDSVIYGRGFNALNGGAVVSGPGVVNEGTGNHGIEVHCKITTVGCVMAENNGGHGIYLKQNDGENLNSLTGTFAARTNGEDGVRLAKDDAASSTDINACTIRVPVSISNSGAGVSQYGGFGNQWRIGDLESNGTGILLDEAENGGGAGSFSQENWIVAGDIEGNTTGININRSTRNFLWVMTFTDNIDGSPHSNVVMKHIEVIHGGFQHWGQNPRNLSGESGDFTGQTAIDSGSNTPSGDPEICVWTGAAWRVSGTTTTFT